MKGLEDLPLEEKIASGRSHVVDALGMAMSPSPFPRSVVDHDGEVTARNYARRDAGNTHLKHVPKGALVLGFFTKPHVFFSGKDHLADCKGRHRKG